jgi:hypothetical protein
VYQVGNSEKVEFFRCGLGIGFGTRYALEYLKKIGFVCMIGDNLKIAPFLFFNRFVKKV